MREVLDHIYHEEYDEELDGYIAIKYIVDIEHPIQYYCNGVKHTWLDKGYSILEYVPNGRGYNCRVFIDQDNRPISLYYDINNGTGKDQGGVYYDDLYLDVIIDTPMTTGGVYFISVSDEKELLQAKVDGIISEATYNKAYETAEKLMAELRSQTNDILNRCENDIVRFKKKINIK